MKKSSRSKAGPSRIGAGAASTVRSMSDAAQGASTGPEEQVGQTDGSAASNASKDPANILKRKDFVDLVVAKSGLKKRDVRTAVDATLSVMGDALRDGKTLSLSAQAKIKPVKQNPFGQGTVVTTKFRMKDEVPTEGGPGLAEDKQSG